MNFAFLRPLVLVALTLAAAVAARATPIAISTTAVPVFTISPSNDTLTLAGSSSTVLHNGTYVIQTGNFYVGNSPIPDQVIKFSFLDSITINGITKNVTIFGQNNVTAATDDITIFAGAPVQFGNVTLTIDFATTSAGGVDQNIPLTLSADISQTPEPASLALFGTGALAFGVVGLRRQRTA